MTSIPGHKLTHAGLLVLLMFFMITLFNNIWIFVYSDNQVGFYQSLLNVDNLKTTPSQRPFHKGSAHQLLILSYQRSGSTFFGDIFGRHPSVVYYYEPIDGVYVSMYRTKEGWNVPSDITNYSNGSERYPPQYELDRITDVLDDLLNCNIDHIPDEVLLHKFWTTFHNEHRSLSAFQFCLGSSRILEICRYHVTNMCDARFNGNITTDTNICFHDFDLLDADSYFREKFTRYTKCVSGHRKNISTCLESSFTKVCEQKPFRVVKTVRATMASVEKLVQRNPDLRVVHLIRDPRAVVLSRRKFDSSAYGVYSIINMSTPDETSDITKEAKLLCSTVLRDLKLRKALEEKYPGIFMEVVYDKFAKSPVESAKMIYDFIGIEMDLSIVDWLNGSHNTQMIADKWRHKLTFQETKDIDAVCSKLYEEMSYKWDI